MWEIFVERRRRMSGQCLCVMKSRRLIALPEAQTVVSLMRAQMPRYVAYQLHAGGARLSQARNATI
jgi:hypothetical protein